jgi:hypothetical protein
VVGVVIVGVQTILGFFIPDTFTLGVSENVFLSAQISKFPLSIIAFATLASALLLIAIFCQLAIVDVGFGVTVGVVGFIVLGHLIVGAG